MGNQSYKAFQASFTRSGVIVILCLLLINCSGEHERQLNSKPSAYSSESSTAEKVGHKTINSRVNDTEHFADNGLGNALAIIQHPAGVHENGITYVSYQGPEVAPYVASYNHSTEEWQGPFKAGESDLAELLVTKNRVDSHGKPTMLIDDLGYIHIFYGGHGAGSKYGKNPYGGGGLGRNKHAISKRPYDISEWENLDNVSIFGTYNQAVKMDNGDIYLIYRHGAHRSDWVYQKSSDHGRSFEPAVPFLKTKLRDDKLAADSWYVWAAKGHGDDIIMSYDYHHCWLRGQGPRRKGHLTQRHDLYYMVFDTQTKQFKNIHDETLVTPITKEIADAKSLVTRTGDKWTFNGSAHVDMHGHPHLAINIGEDLKETNTGGPKQTFYYHWNGEDWSDGEPVVSEALLANTNTRGDFAIDTLSGQARFWMGYQDGSEGVIATFSKDKQTRGFTKEQELLRRDNATWAITARIHNAHPDAQIIVAEKQAGQQWRKMYLIGENGPIAR